MAQHNSLSRGRWCGRADWQAAAPLRQAAPQRRLLAERLRRRPDQLCPAVGLHGVKKSLLGPGGARKCLELLRSDNPILPTA